jgi:hypothetical protein
MYGSFMQDPFGPSAGYSAMMNPETYANTFQFSQNPMTPDVAPSYGIGLGGEVSPSPAMTPYFSERDPYDWRKLVGAGGAIAGELSRPNTAPMPSAPSAPSGGGGMPRPMDLKFVLPLMELMRNARNDPRRA